MVVHKLLGQLRTKDVLGQILIMTVLLIKMTNVLTNLVQLQITDVQKFLTLLRKH
jgi:hypothetical protein